MNTMKQFFNSLRRHPEQWDSISNASPDLSCPMVLRGYQSVLAEMLELLRKNNCDDEASYVQEALSALETHDIKFVKHVTGAGLWGGSGSVTDCHFRGFVSGNASVAAAEQKRLDSLLAELVTLLSRDGMKNPRIESLGQIHKERAGRRG